MRSCSAGSHGPMKPANKMTECSINNRMKISTRFLVRILSACTDARIAGQQHQIGDEISSHHECRGKHDSADHQVAVTRECGLQDEWPQARPAGNYFHQ